MIPADDFARLSHARASVIEPGDIFSVVDAAIRERIGFGLLKLANEGKPQRVIAAPFAYRLPHRIRKRTGIAANM
jgi:hypothetical protein